MCIHISICCVPNFAKNVRIFSTILDLADIVPWLREGKLTPRLIRCRNRLVGTG